MKQITFYPLFYSSYLFADMNIQLKDIINPTEEFTMWLALFGLALIAILALFLSSIKILAFKKEMKEVNQIKDTVQQQYHTILSNMGENIQSIAEENVDVAKKLSKTNDSVSISEDIHIIENSENKLLSIATNLIEFLRLKSNKIKIMNEKLSFSNLFNDVSGTLKTIIKDIPLELQYNLHSKLKENIYADTLNLSKILVNIILFCVENKASNININISGKNNFSKKNNLFFTFSTDSKIDAENSDNIFSAKYDEKTGTYHSLGLFVARELCQLMGGELIARNDTKGNLEFLFDIEYKVDNESEHQIKLPSKKVLIVDRLENVARSSKNIFENLNQHVTTMKKQDYLYKQPDFSQFDLILLDEILFTQNTIANLSKSDKVISLSNLFGTSHKNMNKLHTSLFLQKPLTRKHVQDLLESVYIIDQKEKTPNKEIDTKEKALVFKESFVDSKDVTLGKFSKFRKTKVLLVEDNVINQKVLLGILSKSGMDIVIANNGQEALDKLSEDIKFDIVFMDINMPVMDGYTATKYIRENQDLNTLPIIALTALTSRAEVDSMFDVGMNAFLAKPLKKEKLFSALSMFIVNKKDDRRKSVRYEERISELSGLDIKIGIRNSNSNDFFYKEILTEFQDAYGESDKIFVKLVNDFRYEQLRMFCLDIRGLTASIGAEDLSLLATEVLKLLLFKKYDILRDFIPLYSKSLYRLNDSIEEYISN